MFVFTLGSHAKAGELFNISANAIAMAKQKHKANRKPVAYAASEMTEAAVL